MTIKTRTTVGPDGMVLLNLRVGEHYAGMEVEVVVESPPEKNGADLSVTPSMNRRELTHDEWVRHIEETEGCIDDPTFCRPPAGPPQDRSPIFD